jgi:hypothetical protein
VRLTAPDGRGSTRRSRSIARASCIGCQQSAEALEQYLADQKGRANAIQNALALKGSMSATDAEITIADTDVLIEYLAGKPEFLSAGHKNAAPGQNRRAAF